jgi:hypothetical protein
LTVESFYEQLGLPEACLLDRRIFKKMVLEHGRPTTADKRSVSQEVGSLTWKYSLKPGNVRVHPYTDEEREYLEVAIVEVRLNGRTRASRIAEVIHRAIPYPVMLVAEAGDAFSISVAHKRFSLAEKGHVVAEGLLRSPWIENPPSDVDVQFCEALALERLPRTDFYALYRGMVGAVLARSCAVFSGVFRSDPPKSEEDQRRSLEECHHIEREIAGLRAAIPKETQFAAKVELNTRIKELEGRLARTAATL